MGLEEGPEGTWNKPSFNYVTARYWTVSEQPGYVVTNISEQFTRIIKSWNGPVMP